MQEDPVFFAKFLEEEAIRESQKTAVLGVSISCIVHGDVNVGTWYVQDVAFGQISRGETGGRFSCGGQLALGYPIPLKWRPSLKVKVRWSTYTRGIPEPTWHEKTTTILPYNRVGSVYVHFFPGDHVRVVVATNGATSSTHPIPRDSILPPPEIE
jgi:hypothetical protein